ncbi:dsRBD fold-containing protein, partial [Streptomyces sp. NPDC002172]
MGAGRAVPPPAFGRAADAAGHLKGTAAEGTEVRAHGHASRHESDSNQPRVGEEIAGARAL